MSFLINNPKSDDLAWSYVQAIVNNIQARIVKAVPYDGRTAGCSIERLIRGLSRTRGNSLLRF